MTKAQHEEAISYLQNTAISERSPQFEDALLSIYYKYLKNTDVNLLAGIYGKLKDAALRQTVLRKLFHGNEWQLKQFFLDAYKRERYLYMRFVAVRGYANYASQEEVEKIMVHFLKILKKLPESTPYAYQEYEFLRSACGLPYLIKRYGYPCFTVAYEQEEKQYHDMPDAFKGHYTYDEECNCIL